MADYQYAAFISYRHKELDKAVAKRIHTLIERYRIPRAAGDRSARRLGRAFRDEEELPVSSDLSNDIRKALDHSEYLIVVCTPDTPGSIWVQREIDYFLEHHDRKKALTILAAGDPESSFPGALTHDENQAAVEPLAANICSDSISGSLKKLDKESIRIFAAMIGCPYDELVRREQKRKARKLGLAMALVLAVALGYAVILTRSNSLIENKNKELSALNTSLTEQKRELQLTESFLITEKAIAALDDEQYGLALEYALAALPEDAEDDRPYYAPAETALFSSLDVFEPDPMDFLRTDQSKKSVVDRQLELDAPLSRYYTVDGADTLIAFDEYGTAYSWDVNSLELKWKTRLRQTYGNDAYSSPGTWTPFPVDDERVYAYNQAAGHILALNMENGAVVWDAAAGDSILQVKKIPSQKALLCAVKRNEGFFGPYKVDLVVFSTVSGEELSRVTLDREFSFSVSGFRSNAQDNEPVSICFTPDEKACAGILYDTVDGQTNACYYFYDMEKQEARVACSEPHEKSNIVLWTDLQAAAEGSVLSLIRISPENSRWIELEKINLSTGNVISKTVQKPQSNKDPKYQDTHTAVLRWGKDSLIVCACEQIYLVNLSAFRVELTGSMQADFISLFEIDDNFFGYILADGTYKLAWLDREGSMRTTGSPGTSDLGPVSSAYAGDKGFIRANVENNTIQSFGMGEPDEGYGYIAAADNSNARIIHLKTILRISLPISNRFIGPDANPYNYDAILDGLKVRVSRENGRIIWTESAGEGFRNCCVYDPKLDTVDKTRRYYSNFNGESALITSSLSRIIIIDQQKRKITAYEPGTLTETVLEEMSDFSVAKSVRNESDDRILTASCDGSLIRLWEDGEPLGSIPVPEGINWSSAPGDSTKVVLEIGENGMILLSHYADNTGNSSAITGFYLYDSGSRAWIRTEDPSHGDSGRRIAMGTAAPVFAVYEEDMTIHLYDCRDQTTVRTIRTKSAADSVSDLRFICDDRYLALCTKDGKLDIYDAGSLERVFSGQIGEGDCGRRIIAQTDRSNRRLYIFEQGGGAGLCFDYSSWTLLASFSGYYAFDPVNDEIFGFDFIKGLYSRRIPDREELISMGRELLREKVNPTGD